MRKNRLPMKIMSVTLGICKRCPTCGELPEDFRNSFERRVDELHIVPRKSKHYTVDGDGNSCVYEIPPDDQSDEGLYPAIIVPSHLVGKVVLIKEKEEMEAVK